MSRQASFWVIAGGYLVVGLVLIGPFAGESCAQPTGPAAASSAAVDGFGDALPKGVVRRFGSLRFRHSAGYKTISELAFSPDGERIASAGPDHTVRVWDLDGRELKRFVGRERDPFASVAFSPDGASVAANGHYEMRVWEVASGATLFHSRGRGSSPVFSSNSERVAATKLLFTPMAGYLRRSFLVWVVTSGKLVHSLDSSKKLLWPLAIAVDQGLTVSLAEDGIRVRHLDSGETVCTYREHSAGAQSVALSRDGKMAASSCLHDGVLEIHCWDPATGETRSSYSAKTEFAAYEITFSPDGQTLLGVASVRDYDGGYADGTIAVDSPARIELIDVKTARPRYHIDGFTAPALSPDGSVLAAARFDRIQLFDARTGKTLKQYEGHDAPVKKVAVSSDGKRFASVGDDQTIRYWDAATGKQLSQRQVTGGIGGASFAGNLKRVAVLHGKLERNKRRRITVWDDGIDKPPFDLAMPDGDRLVSLSADGKTLATWGKDDLRVWHFNSRAEPVKIAPPESPGGISGFALSGEGRHVAARAISDSIRIWDTKTATLTREFDPEAEEKWSRFHGLFAIARDGRTLATGLGDTIVVYDVLTGARVAKFPRQTTGYAAEVAFSPDGKLLAASARDGSVRLLSIATGKVLADFQTQAPGWTSIAFTPNGDSLLSGGGAAVLELWDIAALRKAKQ